MIKLGDFTYNQDEVLSCLNFMKNSDVVFSGTLSENDYSDFEFSNTKIISKQNGLVTFVNMEIDIKENHIIYCHLDYIEILFHKIKNLNFKNLKIISTQSDRIVSRKIFNKKPKCVAEWYSVNVNFNDPKLIPIPLGLASYRNTKSVIYEDFNDINSSKKVPELIYVNFNINTNYFHRIKAESSAIKFLKQKIVKNIEYSAYLNNLSLSTYCLAPWGNGFDTHRFWEALYSGVIPITKISIHYESFKDLPIILLDSYQNIENFKPAFDFFDKKLDKLNILWWVGLMREKIISDSLTTQLSFTSSDLRYLKFHDYKIKKTEKIKKILITTLRKIHTKFSNPHKT